MPVFKIRVVMIQFGRWRHQKTVSHRSVVRAVADGFFFVLADPVRPLAPLVSPGGRRPHDDAANFLWVAYLRAPALNKTSTRFQRLLEQNERSLCTRRVLCPDVYILSIWSNPTRPKTRFRQIETHLRPTIARRPLLQWVFNYGLWE